MFNCFYNIELQTLLKTDKNAGAVEQHRFPHVKNTSYIKDLEQSRDRYRVPIWYAEHLLFVDDNSLLEKLNV